MMFSGGGNLSARCRRPRQVLLQKGNVSGGHGDMRKAFFAFLLFRS